MKTTALGILGPATLFLSSCFFLSPALASTIQVNVFQGKAIQVVKPNGTKAEKVIPAEGVVPGDTVVYRYIVNNRGTAVADGVVVDTAIDPNMRYVDGSATAYGAEFSVDGGAVFGRQDDLTVLDVDGTFRNAMPQDITNIRWRLKHAVAPGRPFSVGFRAVLK